MEDFCKEAPRYKNFKVSYESWGAVQSGATKRHGARPVEQKVNLFNNVLPMLKYTTHPTIYLNKSSAIT